MRADSPHEAASDCPLPLAARRVPPVTGPAYSSLLAVSSVSWLARDLASANTIEVRASLGMDNPDLDGRTALWCSGAWALRLLQSGTPHPFLAAGPNWLSSVPEEFLGRRVWTGTADRLPGSFAGPVFCKLSEHKHSRVPARIYPRVDVFAAQLDRALEARRETVSVTFSEPVSFHREYRCFITHGQVTASSFYLSTVPGVRGSDVQITWDAFSRERSPDSAAAAAFAQTVADALGSNQPPGYTLDVGTDAAGNFYVIEANAAWSSNIYHADPSGVIASVLAAQAPGFNRWTWTPDEYFLNRSRPLPAVPAGRTLL